MRDAKIACVVVAPSLVPVKSGNRVKTDRRDAKGLAHFLRSGDLTEIFVPDEEAEAARDLERAREDAKNAERVARHQLGKFLLRHGRRFEGANWTQKHLSWVRRQKFDQQAQQRVLTDHLKTVEDAGQREKQLTEDLAELIQHTKLHPLITALQAFRGIRLITAVTIAAELVDLKRFASPRQLMAFLGLVPSEHSSGEVHHRGRITRAGMGFQNKGELEKAAARFPATAFRCVRSGCSPAEPDYVKYKSVASSDQASMRTCGDSSSV